MNIKTTEIFKKSFKKLFKKDKYLVNQYEELLEQLALDPYTGTLITDGRYKIRLQNKSNNRGKSAGYRIITYTKIEDTILLVHIYSKSDTSTIIDKKIDDIIKNYRI